MWHPLTDTGGLPELRYIKSTSLLDPALSWKHYLSEGVDPIIQATGITTHHWDRIFGLPEDDRKQVQFGAYQAAKKVHALKHLTSHGKFVKAFKDFSERNGIVENIAYVGTPTNDREYRTLEGRTDRKLQYQHDALNSVTEAQFSVGLDASTASFTTTVDWSLANSLAAGGRTVYVESRPHGKSLTGLNVEKLGAYETTGAFELFSNYEKGGDYSGDVVTFTRKENPQSWQDPDLEILGRAKSFYILLHVDTVNFWTMTLDEAAHRIKCWLNYRLPNGKEVGIAIPAWLIRRLVAAGKWSF